MKKLPNFFIAGAPKCGTTTLYQCLSTHPEISFSTPKETHFFSKNAKSLPYKGPGDHLLNSTKYKDWSQKEYMAAFEACNTPLIGDASADYFLFPECFNLIKSTIGDVPIIVILRNPASRAYSAYRNMVERGWETLPYPEAINAEEDRISKNWDFMWHYRACSFYAERLQQLKNTFSYVRILLYEELFENFDSQTQEILNFLGANETNSKLAALHANKTSTPRSQTLSRILANERTKQIARSFLSKKHRTMLRGIVSDINSRTSPPRPPKEAKDHTFFEHDIKCLEEIMGRSLSIWRTE